MNLFINDTKIELAPGEQIILSNSVGRVGEIDSRSGVVSADFDIIASASNTEALGYNNLLESGSTVSPSLKQPAYIEDDGHEITRGFVQIVSWDKRNNRISVAFFGNNTNWFDLLAGKFIADIDLSEYNHTWTEANIVASWSNTDGYIYPFLNYGRLDGLLTASTYIDDWYPAVYQSTIAKKIFEGIGYKVAGPYTNGWTYKNTIIPFTNGQFLASGVGPSPSEAQKGVYSTSLVESPVPGTSDSTSVVLTTPTIATDPDSAHSTSGRYTAQEDLTQAVFRFTINGSAEITMANGVSTPTTCTINFSVKENDSTTLLSVDLLTNTANNTVSATGPWVFDVQTDLASGNYINGNITLSYVDAVTSSTTVDISYDQTLYEFGLIETDEEIQPGGIVTLSNNLPNISQLDFVKDMIIRENLIITTNVITGTVYFTRFDDLYANMGSAVDWSDKVDLGDRLDIGFSEVVSAYARNNYFKYQDPEDDDYDLVDYQDNNNYPLGHGTFTIVNDFLPEDQEYYTSPFGATLNADSVDGGVNTFKLGYIPRFDYSASARFEANPRILYVARDVSTDDINTTGSGVIFIDGTSYSETAYAWFSKSRLNSDVDDHDENLSFDLPTFNGAFGTSLLSRNYSNLLRILNKPRYVEIGVRLWAHEYRNLDFTIPIYIHAGDLQGYFYVDAIEEYEGDRTPAIAKLVQLI